MVICPYCGSENADENKFCDNCGAPLKEQRSEAADLESTVPNESSEDPYGSAEDDSHRRDEHPYDQSDNRSPPGRFASSCDSGEIGRDHIIDYADDNCDD